MIASACKLPWVIWNDQRHVPLSEGWLAESISQSAYQVGFNRWEELSSQVARGIAYFLEKNYQGQSISVDQVQQLMERSLEGVGYAQLAHRVVLVAPRVNISLAEIARQTNYELLFFQTLGERLQEAMNVVVRGIKLEGLKPCVKILEGRTHWGKKSNLLSQEIVCFTRHQIGARNVDLLIC